ncbi:hypothetical protein GCM10010124_08380 [Pilimelia terevasa]|uniref:Uncharacterized protein n=1 Tax=Pilimelia terevasa TaxID=53372 RepID=A0A8J3BFR5_9ACTN|nr:hypothetical protein [Pilimelia terevasa]GGK18090.1 hypothetical protein GCM10010124_08380 [Pilimelia terevasa]
MNVTVPHALLFAHTRGQIVTAPETGAAPSVDRRTELTEAWEFRLGRERRAARISVCAGGAGVVAAGGVVLALRLWQVPPVAVLALVVATSLLLGTFFGAVLGWHSAVGRRLRVAEFIVDLDPGALRPGPSR